MLNANGVTYELSLSAGSIMKVVSRLYSHAAWQAQFCEMQRSEQLDHLAIKAALHSLVTDMTSAKHLPDHVSKEITACFLGSEVKLNSLAATCLSLCCNHIDCKSPIDSDGCSMLLTMASADKDSADVPFQ